MPSSTPQPSEQLNLASTVMERIEVLGAISDEPSRLTRTFGSPAMRRANDRVAGWMREAGMETREDALGNLFGRHAGDRPDARILLLGSHLDTVRDAGKFDGSLGVLVAIACVQQLQQAGTRLPFAIEIAGFADEEGVRFQTTYLGSKVLTGDLRREELAIQDAAGITLAEAIRQFGGNPQGIAAERRDPDKLLGYVEAHIEQGPVLEQQGLGVGVVTAIAGQTRARLIFTGRAGHAGTTPMDLRRDALCAAAEFVLEAERLARSSPGLVATVGQIGAQPGASNVIPGEVALSLDVRHAVDAARDQAVARLQAWANHRASERKLKLDWQPVQTTTAVTCDARLSDLLAASVERRQGRAVRLASGAGHDAAVIATIAPVTMLFVRCKDGLSHHPDELATLEDIGLAVSVLTDFIVNLGASG
jgi:allantoate deiminase